MNLSLPQGLEDNCPECGNLVFFRRGSSQGCYCLKSGCRYGFATTYIPEIETDPTVYEVYVTSLGTNWQQNIVFLALNFNLSINEARQFKIPGQLLLKANAVKVFEVRQKLSDREIDLAIEPNYKYDTWDSNPEDEFTNKTKIQE